MSFNTEISVGDIIAILSAIGSFVMFMLTAKKQSKTKEFAHNANESNESAKRYYDLMIKQLKAEKLIAETKKSCCDAGIVKINSNKWILKVFNKGNARAKNISFKFLDDKHPSILGNGEDAFPIKLLEPQKNVDYHILIHMGTGSPPWEYEINWTNEDDTTEIKKGVLTLPLT